jgi:Zn-dependent protease
MDPVWSIGIPLLFVMIGGMPLIGGRTFVDGHALRSRWWDTAVSLAGPATNLAVAIGIGLSFSLGVVDPLTPFGAGLAFLGLLQIVTAIFNLIPAPPLDGFGALEPHLPPDMARQLRNLGFYGGYFLIIAVLWMVPGLGSFMWDQAWELSYKLDIPGSTAAWGQEMARF